MNQNTKVSPNQFKNSQLTINNKILSPQIQLKSPQNMVPSKIIVQSPNAHQKINIQPSVQKQPQSNVTKLPQINSPNIKHPIKIQQSTAILSLQKTQSQPQDLTIPKRGLKNIKQTKSHTDLKDTQVVMESRQNVRPSAQQQVNHQLISIKPKANSIPGQSTIKQASNTQSLSQGLSRKLVVSQNLSQQKKIEQQINQESELTLPKGALNRQRVQIKQNAQISNQQQSSSQQNKETINNQQVQSSFPENDLTVPRRQLNKPQQKEMTKAQQNNSIKKPIHQTQTDPQEQSVQNKGKPEINENQQTQKEVMIQEQYILEFKEANKIYNMKFMLLTDMRVIIEDYNQKDNQKKQYILKIQTDLFKLIQSIKQSEEVQQSTLKPLDKKLAHNNLNLDSLSDFFFQVLNTPPYRKVFFDYLKINIKDLACSQKENEQFLKACLDQQLTKNNKTKDKSNDRYQFLELLGKGGQGEVWLYYDTVEKKTIVFKKFLKGFSDSFQKEKEILEKIKPANLCPPILSFDDQNYVIQSEKGELSLSQYDDYIKLKNVKMYQQSELFYILKQLTVFVKILHEKFNIFHCDIKPDNIVLVSANYQAYDIKMIDFGGSVDNCSDYPGCYTPAFADPEILHLNEDQITESVCIEGELFCIARTLCKLALKDPSLKTFCKRSFSESINSIGDEYKELRFILMKILKKEIRTCDQVLKEIEKGNLVSDNIKDSLDIVHKIQQEKLQNTQNNMNKEYLLQQIDFYEQMYAYKKGIQTIKTLLNKYGSEWTQEERNDLIMKQTRFEMEIQGIQDLSNIIQSNSKLMGEQVKYFELLLMIAQQDTKIETIIKKSEEIAKKMPQQMSNEAFIINDIIATLLERQCAFDKAIDYRIVNIQIAKILTDKQIPLYTPATQLATCYEQLGLLDKAFEYYIMALQSAQTSVSLDSTNLSNAYQNISIFFKNINSFQKAEEYQKKCLEMRKEGTPDYCNSLSNLASIKEKLGYYKEAINLYQQALTNLRKILGNDHIDVGYVLNNMSLCQQKMGDLKNALNYCLEAYEILKLHLGEKHSIIATCLGNIGDCYRELQLYNQALDYAERSLKINEEISGKDSLYTSNSLEKIGLIYYQLQQYEKAIQNLEKSLRIKKNHSSKNKGVGQQKGEEATQGTQDYQISVLLNNLALAYEGLVLDEKSLELQLESLEIKKNIFENDSHPSLAISLGNIGMTLFKLSKYEQSVDYLKKAIKILSEQNINSNAKQTYESQLQKANEKIKSLKNPLHI